MSRRRQSPPISEALAYARCYGGRGGQIIKIEKMHPRVHPHTLSTKGETLRQAVETAPLLWRRELPQASRQELGGERPG